MKKHVFPVLLSLCILLPSCRDQTTKQVSSLATKLDSLILSEHKANRFDGALVIGTQDSILFEKAIGTSNRVWDIPVHMDHRFDICSINKSLVATLLLIATEEGKLSPHDYLSDHLKNYSYSGQFNKDITLHQMLTHTSGLPHYEQLPEELYKNYSERYKRYHFTNSEYVDFISTIPAVGKPGQQFYYSSFAYHLLAIILEDIYQKPFSELLKEKICTPLQLNHTFSTTSTLEVHKNMAEAYNYTDSTDTWKRNRFTDLTLGRRTFSTAYDLYLWGRAMNTPSLLGPESLKQMQTNHLKGITDEISYGYGWVIFDSKGLYRMGNLDIDRNYIIHGGATEGFKSMLINIEGGEYIIAFLANTGEQTNEMELAKKIVHILISSENEK